MDLRFIAIYTSCLRRGGGTAAFPNLNVVNHGFLNSYYDQTQIVKAEIKLLFLLGRTSSHSPTGNNDSRSIRNDYFSNTLSVVTKNIIVSNLADNSFIMFAISGFCIQIYVLSLMKKYDRAAQAAPRRWHAVTAHQWC